MVSNDGIVIEKMDLSHIHLAVPAVVFYLEIFQSIVQKIKSSIELSIHCGLYTSVSYLIKITKKEGLCDNYVLQS